MAEETAAKDTTHHIQSHHFHSSSISMDPLIVLLRHVSSAFSEENSTNDSSKDLEVEQNDLCFEEVGRLVVLHCSEAASANLTNSGKENNLDVNVEN